MKRIAKKIRMINKRRACSGMTLLEVVLAFGVLTLLFSAYAVFVGQASRLNSLARQTDIMLQNTSATLEAGSSGHTGQADLTFTGQGGASYDVTVEMYKVTNEDVTLSRFEP